MKVILGCALFAPVQYFVHLTRANDALIEVCDSYQRRSYRNRYVIYAANGPMALSYLWQMSRAKAYDPRRAGCLPPPMA